MVAKEIKITGVIEPKNAGELKTVIGRIRHVPAKNAIWANDLKLKTIHVFQPINHNRGAGTLIYAAVTPVPSTTEAYGSLPTRNNYASVHVRNLGTANLMVVALGTFAYTFVAYGE